MILITAVAQLAKTYLGQKRGRVLPRIGLWCLKLRRFGWDAWWMWMWRIENLSRRYPKHSQSQWNALWFMKILMKSPLLSGSLITYQHVDVNGLDVALRKLKSKISKISQGQWKSDLFSWKSIFYPEAWWFISISHNFLFGAYITCSVTSKCSSELYIQR